MLQKMNSRQRRFLIQHESSHFVGKWDALLKFSLKSISPNYMGYEIMKALKFILSSLLEIEITGKRVSILID